jgi:LytS/YehU family sensor histidine kinase
VPTLILLPLIENAVTHGAPLGDGLPIQVTIEAREQHKQLVLRVTNSCRACAPKDSPACAGLGLRNTRERLRLLFGQSAALTENCDTPGRFAAEIRLPAADWT